MERNLREFFAGNLQHGRVEIEAFHLKVILEEDEVPSRATSDIEEGIPDRAFVLLNQIAKALRFSFIVFACSRVD